MSTRISLAIGVAVLCVAAAVCLPPPPRAIAEQPAPGVGAGGRWQIVQASKRMQAPTKELPAIDSTDAILLDTQTGDTWMWDLKEDGYYWRKLERETGPNRDRPRDVGQDRHSFGDAI